MTSDASKSRVSAQRWMALWFAHLATDRWQRTSPGGEQPDARVGRPASGLKGRLPADRPLVAIGKSGNALRLSAVSAGAAALGLMPGMTLADARARLPDLPTVEADPEADRQLLSRLADRALRWSSLVALDPPDGLLIEVAGSAHLFAGEEGLAREVAALLGRHLAVRHGFGPTPLAARALARWGLPGLPEEAAIAALPVAALGLGRDELVALRRAGLCRIGDLAARPTALLAARFGARAADALDRLLGRAADSMRPHRPLPDLALVRRLAEPIVHADAIRACIRGLAGDARTLLEQRGAGARHFHLTLSRTDGAVHRLAIETGAPIRDADRIVRLFSERIETLADPLDPGFGYDVVHLGLSTVEALEPVQSDLLATHGGQESLGALIDRLSVRHGRGRIRRLVPIDTHVPERAARTRPALDLPAPPPWQEPGAGPEGRPIFLLDPPQPIEAIAEVPDAPPRRFRWRGKSHEVVRAEGPERIAAPWWQAASEASPTRDYYRVEDGEGRRFWLMRRGLHGHEATHPRWYVHGLFA